VGFAIKVTRARNPNRPRRSKTESQKEAVRRVRYRAAKAGVVTME
jgi:hypothetical protein